MIRPGRKILGLIPARGGSKRVLNKNIRLLGGQPLIAYTIKAARKSRFINKLIVTTDSRAIANIARRYGAEAPFLRPAAISGDNSSELEFHQHALRWLATHQGYVPDLIVNLYPTTPFRTFQSIDHAIQLMLTTSQADSLRSVRLVDEHPFKMWKRSGQYLHPLMPLRNSNIHTWSYQRLPTVYIQNASIYITRPRTIKKYRSTLGRKVLSFPMDSRESIDINSPLDWQMAEIFLATYRHWA